MPALDMTCTSTPASGGIEGTFAGLRRADVMVMTATAAGALLLTLLPLVDRSLDMSATASGQVTATLGTLTTKLMGMSTRSVGQLSAAVEHLHLTLPLSCKTKGTLDLSEISQAYASVSAAQFPAYSLRVAVPLGRVSGEMTGRTTRNAMRRSAGSGLTVFDAARELYNLWDIEITDPRTITFLRARVLNYINQTVQTIHSRAHLLDFFNLKSYTVSITANTQSVALDNAIQVVRGPVKLASTNAPLSLLKSRVELDQFNAYHYGATAAPSEPRAYYIDSRNQSGSDNVLLTLYIAPTPTDTTSVQFEASAEPPRYDEHDLMAATGLEIPHKHAETLFWPILRHFGIQDSQYSGKPEQRADVDGKYKAAMQALGLYTPVPPELKGGTKE